MKIIVYVDDDFFFHCIFHAELDNDSKPFNKTYFLTWGHIELAKNIPFVKVRQILNLPVKFLEVVSATYPM